MIKLHLSLKIVTLLMICSSVQAQGGGGGGGGAGGLIDLIFLPTYYSQPRSQTCEQKCAGNNDCLQKCKSNSIIAGTVGGTGLFGALIAMICCRNKECFLHKFNRLKKKYNKVDPGSMSQQQYKFRRDKILSWINLSQNAKNYSFIQGTNNFPIKASSKIVKQDPFITEFSIFGLDHFGIWSATGFILCRNGGQMFLWFYKEYNDKVRAGQTGSFAHLVHQSTSIQENLIKGKWFYIGYQKSNVFSGEWTLNDHQITNLSHQIGKQIIQQFNMSQQIRYNKGLSIQSAQELR